MSSTVRRIVVVEDDAGMGRAIERILRAGGFQPILFASAEAALNSGVAPAADCLVLDIQLPGMSGFELYSQVVPVGDEPPAIFITARDEPAVREKAERLGAKSFHPKPFSGRILLDAVKQAIRSPWTCNEPGPAASAAK